MGWDFNARTEREDEKVKEGWEEEQERETRNSNDKKINRGRRLYQRTGMVTFEWKYKEMKRVNGRIRKEEESQSLTMCSGSCSHHEEEDGEIDS